jgi:hypothetical protein
MPIENIDVPTHEALLELRLASLLIERCLDGLAHEPS